MNAPTLTLATSGTVYNLFTLAKAVQATISPSCNQLIITAGPGNSGNVFIGDSAVSSSIFGSKLPATGSANFNGTFNGIGMEAFYLVADADAQKINIIANRM